VNSSEQQQQQLPSLVEQVRQYPLSARRLPATVRVFSIEEEDIAESNLAQTIHISPFGVEFYGVQFFTAGTLLKLHLPIPDYWRRKQRYVSYRRVDVPTTLQVLVKVVTCLEKGKIGRKKITLAEMVNIDRIDEEVLKEYLSEDKHSRSGGAEKLEVSFT
jgi:hypothetical protein